MQKFTCIQVKEVASYHNYEEDVFVLAENLSNIEPIKCFFLTGHLFAEEVTNLPEIAEIVERTYIKKKYLVEIDMLEYEEGNLNPHDEDELGYVVDNFDRLCGEEKVDIVNVDYFTLDITEV